MMTGDEMACDEAKKSKATQQGHGSRTGQEKMKEKTLHLGHRIDGERRPSISGSGRGGQHDISGALPWAAKNVLCSAASYWPPTPP